MALFTHVALRPETYRISLPSAPVGGLRIFRTAQFRNPLSIADKVRMTPPDSLYGLPFLPQLVETVDLHSSDWTKDINGVTKVSTARFSALRTVRRFDTVCLLELHPDVVGITLVDFCRPPQGWDWVYSIIMPKEMARWVIHIEFDVTRAPHRDEWLYFRSPGDQDDHVRPFEVTIVLWPVSCSRVAHPAATFGFLPQFMSHITDDYVEVNITVVGMEDVSEVHRASADVLWQQYLEYREGRHWVRTGDRDRFRLVTREEWWAELGDQKDIVGVWPVGE